MCDKSANFEKNEKYIFTADNIAKNNIIKFFSIIITFI